MSIANILMLKSKICSTLRLQVKSCKEYQIYVQRMSKIRTLRNAMQLGSYYNWITMAYAYTTRFYYGILELYDKGRGCERQEEGCLPQGIRETHEGSSKAIAMTYR